MKYHIEANSIQETLVIPLLARMIRFCDDLVKMKIVKIVFKE